MSSHSYTYRFPPQISQRIQAAAGDADLAVFRRQLILSGAQAIKEGRSPELPKFRNPGRPRSKRLEITGGSVVINRSEASGTISINLGSDVTELDWAEVCRLYREQKIRSVGEVAHLSLGEGSDAAALVESVRRRREPDSSLIRRCLIAGLILEEQTMGSGDGSESNGRAAG